MEEEQEEEEGGGDGGGRRPKRKATKNLAKNAYTQEPTDEIEYFHSPTSSLKETVTEAPKKRGGEWEGRREGGRGEVEEGGRRGGEEVEGEGERRGRREDVRAVVREGRLGISAPSHR